MSRKFPEVAAWRKALLESEEEVRKMSTPSVMVTYEDGDYRVDLLSNGTVTISILEPRNEIGDVNIIPVIEEMPIQHLRVMVAYNVAFEVAGAYDKPGMG